MKELEEILSVFQVGTRRAPLPKIDLLPDIPDQSPERKLLVVAGAATLMAKAGAKPALGCQSLPEAPLTEEPVANGSEEALIEAFTLSLPLTVLEWSRLAAKKGLVAPHRTLPLLIELARKHPQDVVPVLGVRGIWLAETMGVNLPKTSEEKFRATRRDDPAAYRNWLEQAFGELEFEDRLDAVSVLSENLNPQDEALLKKAADDRRKEIRTAATKLLAGLRGSEVNREVIAIVESCIKHEKSLLRERLLVEPPEVEAVPKWLPKLELSTLKGPKAVALGNLLSMIPPQHWSDRFRTPPRKFLELVLKTDYARAMLDGISHAAVLFKDQEWIDETFSAFHRGDFGLGNDWARMAPHVSEPVFDGLLMALLNKGEKWSHPLLYSLYFRHCPFSPALTRSILANMRAGAMGELVTEMVYYFHPATALESDLEMPEGYNAESYAKKFRLIIQTRHRLLSTLNL